jgi:hypothetical protein
MAQPFRYQACNSSETITKGCFLQLLGEGTGIKTFFDKLEDDQWSIISFDRVTKDICILVAIPSGQTYLSITLASLPGS